MEKEKRTGNSRSGSQRRLQVNVIDGNVPLMECMKHIIRGKHNLK